jgi:hypothetical protein
MLDAPATPAHSTMLPLAPNLLVANAAADVAECHILSVSGILVLPLADFVGQPTPPRSRHHE